MKKYLLVLIIVLVFSSLAFGQSITINWIAMHGEGGTSDFVFSPGETINCRVNYSTSSMDNILGIFGRDNNTNLGSTRLHWYDDSPPADGDYNSSEYEAISNFVDEGTGSSKNATFDFTLPTIAENAESIQLRLGLYGEDTEEEIVYSTCYMSYVARGSYGVPSGSPISGWQAYMSLDSDTSTEAPTLDSPLENSTISEDFDVQYDQPETAYENSVKLTFTRTGGSADSGSPHVCQVISEASGTDIVLEIKGYNLDGADGISSMISGTDVLADDAVYTIKIEYQDLSQNTVAYDEQTGITYDNDDYFDLSGSDYNAGTSFSPDTDNNAFFRIKFVRVGSGSTPNVGAISFDITGSFEASDIDLLKIWRSTDDSFSDTADDLLISEATNLDPFEPDFNPDEDISGTMYYFLTVDVSASANGADEIGAKISDATDITASIDVHGNFPIEGSTHPLPVTLSSFTVVLSGQPVIYWTTQSETNNAYWNIYRGISQNLGQAIQINYGDLIPGQGTVTEPTDYSYIDNYPIVENTTYWYWLECVDNAGEADILGPVSLFIPEGNGNNGTPATPDDYGLKQNYPNPFNPDTKINFALVEDSPVRLTIYNIKGEKIKTIFEDFVPADMVQTAYWDGKDANGKRVASGVYLYRLRTNKTEFNRRMLLMK